ncbi:MAG: response regulator [Rhodospirillales bacterium]|nr:MAG: response regulator [Rhodospirillales bacterium]
MTAKVVVVEDNPMNMKLLEQALGIAGYATLRSPDGENITDMVAGSDARLVLMDIQLPRVSGIDLMKRLKADPRTQAVPVLAVTAFADMESVSSFRREGFDDVITKPISIRKLLEEVLKYCGPGDTSQPS